MNHLICKLVYPYLNEDYLTIYKLVCRDFRDNINLGYRGKVITPHSVLTSKSLLSYSKKNLKLVIDEKVKETIIKIGDLDSIKYLYTETDIIYPKCLNISVENGNLDIMKWFIENGCPFDAFTFTAAAKNGNLDNMKWLLENGCPFGKDPFGKGTFMYAKENGNQENIDWLIDNGCPQN